VSKVFQKIGAAEFAKDLLIICRSARERAHNLLKKIKKYCVRRRFDVKSAKIF
jgi:hypothetical protein